MAGEDGGVEVKDVTATSFGLIIGYLLPGLMGLYGLSFVYTPLRTAFSTFQTVGSNVGLFLVVVLAALTMGLFANSARWVIFDVLCGRPTDQIGTLYARLGTDGKVGAYRIVIDERYRYHQWAGGTFFMLPILYFGWLASPEAGGTGTFQKVIVFMVFFTLEVVMFCWAQKLRQDSIDNIKAILTETH